jgi:hypothetical protein
MESLRLGLVAHCYPKKHSTSLQVSLDMAISLTSLWQGTSNFNRHLPVPQWSHYVLVKWLAPISTECIAKSAQSGVVHCEVRTVRRNTLRSPHSPDDLFGVGMPMHYEVSIPNHYDWEATRMKLNKPLVSNAIASGYVTLLPSNKPITPNTQEVISSNLLF